MAFPGASKAEIDEALKLFNTLPRRDIGDGRQLRLAFTIALDGVHGLVLARAVEAILRGSLGHPFMPSPPELRIECDRVFFEIRQSLLTNGMFAEMPTPEQAIAYLLDPEEVLTT